MRIKAVDNETQIKTFNTVKDNEKQKLIVSILL